MTRRMSQRNGNTRAGRVRPPALESRSREGLAPFSEWTTKFPNARLCKAMLDRLTDQANIIETGTNPAGSGERWRRKAARHEPPARKSAVNQKGRPTGRKGETGRRRTPGSPFRQFFRPRPFSSREPNSPNIGHFRRDVAMRRQPEVRRNS